MHLHLHLHLPCPPPTHTARYETKLLNEHNAVLSKTLQKIDGREMRDEFINKDIEPRHLRTTNYGARVKMARTIHQRNWALLNQLRKVSE